MNAVLQSVDYWRNTDSTVSVDRTMDRRRPVIRSVGPALLTDQEPKYAPWLGEVATQVEELLALQDNWDSYGASAPSRAAAGALLEILTQIASTDTPRPAIVPSPAGHFQAEWHENGIDLEVEVISRAQIDVLFETNYGGWSHLLKSDLTILVEAIDQLSA